MALSVALLGAGYWGKNLVRNFHSLKSLGMICDLSPQIVDQNLKDYPGIEVTSDFESAFKNPKIAGIVISTPAVTHFDLAKKALLSGKHVYVEKPLSLKLSEGFELLELAKTKNKVLMVGHLLQYHPGMLKLKDLIDSGELGKLEYIYSNRLNLGKIRTEENILWSFAPHDISIMLWFVGSLPIQVNAVGGSYLQPNVPDSTISTYVFDHGVRAHVYVSWLHPFKEQRLVVVGSKQMASFDAQAPEGLKLRIYKKNVVFKNGRYEVGKADSSSVPFDDKTEPLQLECQHFLDCIALNKKPRTDGEEGLRVLTVLDACQRSLQMNGQPVQVTEYRRG